MALATFATREQYWTSIGLAEADFPTDDAEIARIDALLVKASGVVRRMTRTARLNYTTEGFPSASSIRDAFVAATCAIVEDWEDTGDVSGRGGQWDSVAMDGVSYSRTRLAGEGSRQSERYPPLAVDALVNAGIFTTKVSHPGGVR